MNEGLTHRPREKVTLTGEDMAAQAASPVPSQPFSLDSGTPDLRGLIVLSTSFTLPSGRNPLQHMFPLKKRAWDPFVQQDGRFRVLDDALRSALSPQAPIRFRLRQVEGNTRAFHQKLNHRASAPRTDGAGSASGIKPNLPSARDVGDKATYGLYSVRDMAEALFGADCVAEVRPPSSEIQVLRTPLRTLQRDWLPYAHDPGSQILQAFDFNPASDPKTPVGPPSVSQKGAKEVDDDERRRFDLEWRRRHIVVRRAIAPDDYALPPADRSAGPCRLEPPRAFPEDWTRPPRNSDAFYNDFLLADLKPRLEGHEVAAYAVAYDLVLLLALRRSIYVRDIDLRSYNIALPPYVLRQEAKGEDPSGTSQGFLAVPVISMRRRSRRPSLRQALGVHLFLIPVALALPDPQSPPTLRDVMSGRSLTLRELGCVSGGPDRLSYKIGGRRYFEPIAWLPPGAHLSSEDRRAEDGDVRYLDAILREQVREALGMLVFPDMRPPAHVWHDICEQVDLSLETGIDVRSGAIRDEDMREFMTGRGLAPHEGQPRPSVVEELAKQILLPDAFRPTSRNIEGQTCSYPPVHIGDLRVNDAFGLDNDTVNYYQPESRLLLNLSPLAREQFPGTSLKWSITWTFYLTSGLSAIRSILFSSFRSIDRDQSATSLKRVNAVLMSDVEAFYNLDIHDYDYRDVFEHLKEKAGVRAEYSALKDEVRAISQAEIMTKEDVISKIVAVLTAVSTAVAIFVVLFSLFHWLLIPSAVVSLLGAGVAVAIPGYLLVDEFPPNAVKRRFWDRWWFSGYGRRRRFWQRSR